MSALVGWLFLAGLVALLMVRPKGPAMHLARIGVIGAVVLANVHLDDAAAAASVGVALGLVLAEALDAFAPWLAQRYDDWKSKR